MDWKYALLAWVSIGFVAGVVRYAYWVFEESRCPGIAKLRAIGLRGLFGGMLVLTVCGPLSAFVVGVIIMESIGQLNTQSLPQYKTQVKPS